MNTNDPEELQYISRDIKNYHNYLWNISHKYSVMLDANIYKFSQGLSKHRKSCIIYQGDKITSKEQITPELILKVIEQNKELTNIILQQNNTINKLCDNNNNTNNNNRNNTDSSLTLKLDFLKDLTDNKI